MRSRAQHISQQVGKRPWLDKLQNVSVGTAYHSFAGEVEAQHPHDTPPYPFIPSPTFAHSSSHGVTGVTERADRGRRDQPMQAVAVDRLGEIAGRTERNTAAVFIYDGDHDDWGLGELRVLAQSRQYRLDEEQRKRLVVQEREMN